MISNRVGILSRGHLQTIGTLDELLAEREVTITVCGDAAAVAQMEEAGMTVDDRIGNRVRLRVPDDSHVYDALHRCKAANLTPVQVAPRRETLEELFVRVVGGAEAAAKEGSA